MTHSLFSRLFLALALAGLAVVANVAHADASVVRLSHGPGILYLPLMVMRDQHLIEKHAKAMGLGDVTTSWSLLDGAPVVNAAMLAGDLDVAGIGAPGFIALWSKAHGNARSEVTCLGALSTAPLWLNTNNPSIQSLSDFTAKDKIAVPAAKVSIQSLVLQMAVAKTFGMENYAKLDPMTVTLGHPEAVNALLSGKTEITAHFASPPFSYQELKNPKIRRVLNSTELLGPITLMVISAPKRFSEQNPTLTMAIMAAQEEANAFIRNERKGAAETYLRVAKVKLSQDEIEKMLADPDTQFSTTPVGIMQYVVFMNRGGAIKTIPAKWSDLFVPAFGSRNGS